MLLRVLGSVAVDAFVSGFRMPADSVIDWLPVLLLIVVAVSTPILLCTAVSTGMVVVSVVGSPSVALPQLASAQKMPAI